MTYIKLPAMAKIGETHDAQIYRPNVKGRCARVTWQDRDTLVIEPCDARKILDRRSWDDITDFLCTNADGSSATWDDPAEPTYKAGDKVRFHDIDGLGEDFGAHSGQIVTILRPLSWHDEYENLGDPLYRVRAEDGWESEAWESEFEEVQAFAEGSCAVAPHAI